MPTFRKDTKARLATMEETVADIKAQLAELVTKVNDQRTVVNGVTTMLQGLKDQLEAMQGELDAAGETEAAATLAGIIIALDENTARLAEAVAANTPADSGEEAGPA